MRKILIFLVIICSVAICAPLFYSFNSGELTPLLKYRVDLQKRQMGVETMENTTVKSQGAIFRRPGTEYIDDVNDHYSDTRLIPFEFSTTDTYILCFNGSNLSFYRTIH